MDAFAAERAEVMATWDHLRERARDEGEAVALGPAFRDTLERHGALMKRAATFRARPRVIYRRAHDVDVASDALSPFQDWLERNERLLRAGRAILDDPGTYRVHLDHMEGFRGRLRDAVSRMEELSAENRSLSQSRDRGPTRSL